jgi:hypothetical protein
MIVIFDLDETLGYFLQFGIFYDCLHNYLLINNNYILSQQDFISLLDLYPEFLRPNIITILNYLKYEKINKNCDKIMIYTNNQGPQYWVENIVFYFEHKLKFKLFDKVINAFKINGKHIELGRTTHEKTIDDFINCCDIDINTKIFFLDDTYHRKMRNHNVYYLNIKPYIHNLFVDTIITRFNNSVLYFTFEKNIDITKCLISNMYKFKDNYKNKNDYDIDKIISKQIIYHLQIFFNKKKLEHNKISS